jgi:hypothetical protein
MKLKKAVADISEVLVPFVGSLVTTAIVAMFGYGVN